jgi:hypothetical protein
MQPPQWLAPLTGIFAFGSCLALVGVHVYGRSLPEQHVASARAELSVSADQAWDLLIDHQRRTEWRRNVVRVGRIEDVDGHQVWRELDRGEDRFDFIVLALERPKLVYATARPQDIGMSAEWTWTVEDRGGHAVVEVTEVGSIRNELVRGWWGLFAGPHSGIEPDLEAFARALGAEARVELE